MSAAIFTRRGGQALAGGLCGARGLVSLPWHPAGSREAISPHKTMLVAEQGGPTRMRGGAAASGIPFRPVGRCMSTVVTAENKNAFSYCISSVKRYDYYNYLCIAALPKEQRAASFVLRAFNVETGQVMDQTKEVALAHMRLQWWRGMVDGAFKGQPEAHPVAEALHAVLQGGKLTKRWLTRIIEAREGDVMMEGPPADIEALEKYAEGTASSVLYLQLESAGIRDRDADHVASHLGKAAGLVAVLRGTGHHARARRTYLPQALLSKHKVSQEDVLRGEVTEGLKDVVLEVASAAKSHVDHARTLQGVSKEALPYFLMATPVVHYLEKLERCDFDPFRAEMEKESPLGVQAAVAWHAFRGTW